MPLPRKVAIICTGNMCRSAAAHWILADRIRAAGLPVEIVSAGTRTFPDEPAWDLTAEAARDYGFDLEAHRSSPVSTDLMKTSDVILAMARMHEKWLKRHKSAAPERIHLFKPYCQGSAPTGSADDEIPDPVSEPLEGHRACVAEITRLVDLLVERWKREHGEGT